MTFTCVTNAEEWTIQLYRGEVSEMERIIHGKTPLHTVFKALPNRGEIRLTTPIKEAVFQFFTANAYDLVCNSLNRSLRGADKELMEQVLNEVKAQQTA